MADNDFVLSLRETVTIVRPMPSVVPRGTNSTRDRQPSRSIRFEEDQLDAMDKAADLLNMSRSAFVKWCAYHVALDILEQHNQFVKRGLGS